MFKNLLIIGFALVSFVGMCQQNTELSKVETLMLDSRYEEAIQFIDASLSTSKNSVLLSIKKAEALIKLGRLAEAETLLSKVEGSLGTEKNPLYYKALIAMNTGSIYQNQGRNDLAIEQFQQAIGDLEKDKRSANLEAAEALAYLGNIYRSTGKYVQAEEQLQRALAIRQAKLPETHDLMAASYNDLGLVYTQLDVDKAFASYEKALVIYKKLHGEDHPKLAITNTNLGVLYRSEELYGDAVNYFEAALKIWEKIFPQPHPNKALVLMNLGQTYSSIGDTKAALGYYERALAMYEQSQGKKHPDVAYVYNLLGNEKLAQRQFDEALIDYQKALIANTPDFKSENILVNPGTKNYYNGNQLLYSLMYKAQALEAKHFGKR